EDMMNSLNTVVWVIVLSAGLLAIVALYNLTNINITERTREIATLKVLGFYDRDVNAYVYRENLWLTLIGTLLGLIMGVFLHRFVILTAEIDNLMFQRVVNWPSFIYAAAFTMACTFVVNLFMSPRLKHIDMISSLKSAE
ncbi:MAG: ABC transporter permease, partial [Oscillospiraceae bacterium]|nr:ABC transporter permease [Oscillospiraceae bacterium]